MQSNRRAIVFLGILVLAGAIFLLNDPAPEKTVQSAIAPPPSPPTPVLDEFGIASSSLKRTEIQVRRGETFSDILGSQGVPVARVHEIVEAAGEALDVRRIRPGDRFFVYESDSLLRHLVYQPDIIDYVVLDMTEPVRVRTGKKPVEMVRKTISGTIQGSLYGAMVTQGGDPSLVDRIANDIYAWTIDFRHLQPGDAFSVIYEEMRVDGEFAGIGEVIAVRFDHSGSPHYAYRFEQDGFPEYFDQEGNSLRKALLKSPLRFTAITSGYSKRRFHPVQKRYKAHLGTDYAAPTGTPIWSVGDGVVLEAQYKGGNGNYVKIRHNGTYTTGYLHMSRIAKGMRPGVRVKQGEIIGYVGSTGLATGPHVCYRFWKNGVQVDPRKEEMPPSEPIQDQNRQAFAFAMAEIRPELDAPLGTVHLAVENTATESM